MDFVIAFFQGLVSFVSPCMLAMLPLCISYFAGHANKKSSTLLRSIFFILGFTFVLSLCGMFAGVLGSFFTRYETAVHLVCGAIIVALGLNFLGILPLPQIRTRHAEKEVKGLFSSFLFGILFLTSHIPCISAFLFSSLTLAAHTGSALHGVFLLAAYGIGMGLPFLVAALCMDRLTKVLQFINRHQKTINRISGILLVLLGILMMTGILHGLMCCEHHLH